MQNCFGKPTNYAYTRNSIVKNKLPQSRNLLILKEIFNFLAFPQPETHWQPICEMPPKS